MRRVVAITVLTLVMALQHVPQAQAAIGLKPAAGQFYPVWHRVATAVTIAPNATFRLPVTGVGGVPSALGTVSSVALNLTVRGAGGAGSLIAYPSGVTAPATRAVSYRSNVDDATLVIIKAGTDGTIGLKNSGVVTATVSADLHGYFSAVPQSSAGSTYAPLNPARVANWVSIAPDATYALAPLGQSGIPSSGVSHVAMTLTAVGSASGALTVFPSGGTRPLGANLLYSSNAVTQNLVFARFGTDGKALVHNAGTANVIIWADALGYLVDSSAVHPGSATVPVAPTTSVASATIPAGASFTLSPLGSGGVPASGVSAVGIAVTARSSTAGTLRVYPSSVADPGTHTLGFGSNMDATTFLPSKLGTDGKLIITNTGSAAATISIDIYAYFRAPGKPSAPYGVNAFAGDRAALVTWRPSTADGGAAIGAHIVKASPGGQTLWVAGDATAALMTGLTNGQEYTFTVAAVNAVGGGTASDPSVPSRPITPIAPAPPGQPLITDTYPRDGAVRVSWSPPDRANPAVTSYTVTANPGGASVSAPANAAAATVTGLTNGTRYTFTVTAINSVGQGVSAPSQPIAPEPARTPLSPPITQVIALSERIDVRWAVPADGGSPITGYTVSATPGGPTVSVPAGTTIASLTGLANDRAYTVSVIASNKAGGGEPAVRQSVVPKASRAPEPPTGVRATVTANGSAEVSWEAPVDVGTNPIGVYGLRASPGDASLLVGPEARRAVFNGLDPTVRYTFVVIAVSIAGQSVPSAPTQPILPKLTVKATPVVFSPAALSTLRQIHSDGRLDFEQPPAEVTNLTPGTTVVIGPSSVAPRGFFGKVLSINVAGGLFVVYTKDGSLTDLLSEGAFAVNAPVRLGGTAGFEPLSPGVSQAQGIDLRDGALVINLAHRLDFAEGANAGNIEATMTVRPMIDISASISGDVTTDSTLGMSFEAQATANIGPIEWTTEIPLAKIKGECLYVSIGPVTVVLCPEFTAKIKITVLAGGGVEVKVGYGREVGVRIHTHNLSAEATPFNNELKRGASIVRPYGVFGVTLAVPVEANLYLYNVVGPGAKVEPAVKGLLDTRATDHCWTVDLTITADAWIRSREFFGHKLDWTFSKIVDFTTNLARADGPCQGIRVMPELARTGVGQPVQFTVEGMGGIPNTPITWRVVNGPGTIDATGRYIYGGNGFAVIEAIRPASGGLIEYRSRASVITGTPPPGSPLISQARPGPFSIEVTWTPPVPIPGQTITQYALITDPATRTTYVDDSMTRARLTGLTPGSPYSIRVIAIAGSLVGSPSPWAGPVTPVDAFARIGAAGDVGTEEEGQGSALSGNGRYLFHKMSSGYAFDLPEIYQPGGTAVYLIRIDLQTGQRVLASRKADGTPMTVESLDSWPDATPKVAPTPDGTKVVYASNNGLYLHDLVARQTKLVYNESPLDFAVSADGSVVTVTDAPAGTIVRHLYRTVNGGPPQRIDNCFFHVRCDSNEPFEMLHDLSADGSKIVFQEDSQDADGRSNAHVMLYDATNGSTTDLTPGLSRFQNASRPVISPDGTTYAADFWDGDNKGVVVKKIGAGPPGPADLVANSTGFGVGGIPFALSRDGSVLALRFRENNEIGQLQGFTYSRAGGLRRLHNNGAQWIEWGLDISDDGQIVSWQPAECVVLPYITCYDRPGQLVTRLA